MKITLKRESRHWFAKVIKDGKTVCSVTSCSLVNALAGAIEFKERNEETRP
jgi:hypothetical protein